MKSIGSPVREQVADMKRIVLCDDSRAWLAKASEILNKYIEREGRDTEVLCFDEPAKCIEGMPADTEAVFMDIEWEKSPEGAGDAAAVVPESAGKAEPEGIAAAAEINQRYPGCRVIYLTNHLGYALDVYNTEHAWYVLKEQFEERLPQIFEKLRTLDAEKLYEIVVRTTGNVTVKIPCREIFFTERRGRTTAIVTEKGIFEIREKIPDVMKLLPEDCFARCHNSIIVNMARVQEIYSGSLRMEDGTELPISRGHSRAFRIRYMNWAKSRML